ncbi:MAG: hypothetical protein J6T79_01595, partial [Verrucomicrobia bacterium]|nr:hypothetical protein [Verrucomicrobiota bacterium]
MAKGRLIHLGSSKHHYQNLADAKQIVEELFAPTDEALFQFYRQKGVNGIEALGKDYATALVKTMTYD